MRALTRGHRSVILVAVCVASVACGSDPTPSPTPVPAPTPAPAALTASFTVNSTSRGANACAVVPGSSGNTLDCTFNGSASTGAIQAYQWEYFVGTSRDTQRTTTPTATPLAGCGFLSGQAPQNVGGVQFIQMDVRLRVEGAAGALSAEVRNLNVRLFPNNSCGYGF